MVFSKLSVFTTLKHNTNMKGFALTFSATKCAERRVPGGAAVSSRGRPQQTALCPGTGPSPAVGRRLLGATASLEPPPARACPAQAPDVPGGQAAATGALTSSHEHPAHPFSGSAPKSQVSSNGEQMGPRQPGGCTTSSYSSNGEQMGPTQTGGCTTSSYCSNGEQWAPHRQGDVQAV